MVKADTKGLRRSYGNYPRCKRKVYTRTSRRWLRHRAKQDPENAPTKYLFNRSLSYRWP